MTKRIEFTRPKFNDLTLSYADRATDDSKKGYNATINAVGKWVVQPKYDGRWSILTHEKEHEVLRAYTRHGRLVYAWRSKALSKLLAFELHCEHMFGTNASLGSPLHGDFIVFDATVIEDSIRHLPLETRLVFAKQVVDKLPPKLKIKMIDSHIAHHPTSVPRLIEQCSEGVEGAVLKPADSVWGEGWVRIKPVYTMDYVFMGINHSDAPSFVGVMAKSVIGGLYIDGVLKPVCNVSGMTDEQRYNFYQDTQSYVGKVFTASGKGVFPSGALRHPNFIEMHADKEPRECVLLKDDV